ncbi:hypothetical protein [Aquisphaera insulae]|uniref:hypothetical protein n=1 Tax=Aquisphaera insulae TaxID=2712864 RepID=UPI0013EA71DC|nr:hypothetical protein [Aquisphaera insulae]
MLALGPMPEAVRVAVRRLVAEARREQPGCDVRLGLLLSGGPSGCSYLDAEGEVWNWSAWDETIERVEDGPLKVGLVAIAADRVPELAAWLPRPPAGAATCGPCAGGGWLLPPWPRVQCPECSGLGWVPPEGAP